MRSKQNSADNREVNGPTVLVVEDDPSVQTTLCATLTLVGYTPYGARSVETALQILAKEHVDAVILDISLPDPTGLQRSGLTLLASLRATPVMIFTGRQLSSDDAAIARKHNAEVFYKPQSYSVLISHVSRLLHPEHAA